MSLDIINVPPPIHHIEHLTNRMLLLHIAYRNRYIGLHLARFAPLLEHPQCRVPFRVKLLKNYLQSSQAVDRIAVKVRRGGDSWTEGEEGTDGQKCEEQKERRGQMDSWQKCEGQKERGIQLDGQLDRRRGWNRWTVDISVKDRRREGDRWTVDISVKDRRREGDRWTVGQKFEWQKERREQMVSWTDNLVEIT